MIQAILFDLDGVIRIYSDEDTQAVEEAFSLPSGCIDAAAFTRELLERVTTGAMSRKAWVAAVGEAIGCIEAAEAWERRPVRTDPNIVAVVDGLKAQGIRVCLITNGTDNLREELRSLGLSESFEKIFNSAELGYAKPSPEIFRIAVDSLRLPATRIAYVDDTTANVASASHLGIQATVYTGISALHEWLRRLGLTLPGV